MGSDEVDSRRVAFVAGTIEVGLRPDTGGSAADQTVVEAISYYRMWLDKQVGLGNQPLEGVVHGARRVRMTSVKKQDRPGDAPVAIVTVKFSENENFPFYEDPTRAMQALTDLAEYLAHHLRQSGATVTFGSTAWQVFPNVVDTPVP
jgi:hypothetical protein